ncbi:MAG TPA: integrase arm-type DNA-binding domain-containing protein, partial [Holophagaceae bacterium]|nr:integrase arm-type DNA-binding domain-containing protein [Holophagaceae bacterium]
MESPMTDRSIRFTKTAIEKLALEALRYEVFDSATPGFGIRVSRTGEKTFFLRYRPKSGAQHRRVTLGRFGEVTLDQARSHALKLKGRIVEGADPNSDREKRKAASTMKDLTERFLRDHVEVHCKASTARNYRSQIRDYVLPRLGRLLASEVDPGHVSKLIATFKDRPYQGNRLRALLSKMFRMAEVWGIRPLGSNPCMGVPKYKESKRHRHLGVDELASIGEALDQAEERGDATSEGVLALRLLLLTGCRRGEILNLRWEHVDLEAGALNLPDSKTGAKRVVLAPPAVALLAEAAGQKLSPWVCPGRDLKLPLVG